MEKMENYGKNGKIRKKWKIMENIEKYRKTLLYQYKLKLYCSKKNFIKIHII